MTRRLIAFAVLSITLSTIALMAQQSPGDDDRRAALRVMRAINTAENATKVKGGKYLSLIDLMQHPSMGGVAPQMKVAGTTVSYDKWQLRLALSADASQYMVNMIAGDTCGLALFTDERGLIYTGKVLDC